MTMYSVRHVWHTLCKKGTNGKRMSCSLLIGHMQIFKSIDLRTMGLWIWITFFWYALYNLKMYIGCHTDVCKESYWIKKYYRFYLSFNTINCNCINKEHNSLLRYCLKYCFSNSCALNFVQTGLTIIIIWASKICIVPEVGTDNKFYGQKYTRIQTRPLLVRHFFINSFLNDCIIALWKACFI